MPPLFPALHWIWMKLAGCDEAGARSLSLLFSLATLGLVACQARRVFNSDTAKLLLLGFALSEASIFYAREARCYSMLLFLCVLAWFYWLKLILQPGSACFRRCLGLCVACSLAALTHYFGVLLAGALYLALMWQDRNAWRRAARWAGWAFLALLPVLVWAVAQYRLAATSMTGVSQPFATPFAHSVWSFLRLALAGQDAGVVFLLIWPAALVAVRVAAWDERSSLALRGTAFVLAAVMAVLLLASLRRNVIQERYLLVILPGLYLAVVLMVLRLAAAPGAALGLLLVMGGGLAGRAPAFWYPSKEQWRESLTLAHNLSANASAVVFVGETINDQPAGGIIPADPAARSWLDQLWLYYLPPEKTGSAQLCWMANNLSSYSTLQARHRWPAGSQVVFVRLHGLPLSADILAALRPATAYLHRYPLLDAEVVKVRLAAPAGR